MQLRLRAAPLFGHCYEATGKSVADTLDAMISDRPYRKAMATSAALAELVEHAGAQFDPLVVEALTRVVRRSRGATGSEPSPTLGFVLP